jgi:hypothetical protein
VFGTCTQMPSEFSYEPGLQAMNGSGESGGTAVACVAMSTATPAKAHAATATRSRPRTIPVPNLILTPGNASEAYAADTPVKGGFSTLLTDLSVSCS